MWSASKPTQYVSRNSWFWRLFSIIWYAMPMSRAVSVPGRTGTHSSASASAVWFSQGSTMMILPVSPRAVAIW